ncbi:MAG: isoprenylcysteine carboxylmethyltransferase family protein [Betaproteobacteria bacterium]|nr:MAG: isoprenylcysteine carboxylmethyltransferase family protein [Betaproteobacteria bacterium]
MNALLGAPPAAIITATIWIYWLCVGFMIVRARRQKHALAGLVPEKRFERALWLILVPVIVAWIVLPWLALTRTHPALAVPEIAQTEPAYAGIRWIAAICGIICLAITIQSWARMGKNWRMDVSDRKSELITDGPFAHIRHPIYGFQMLLMVCTAIIVPTTIMLVVAIVHIVLMNIKARNEERHLLAMHGEAYARYLSRTGRFIPRAGRSTR